MTKVKLNFENIFNNNKPNCKLGRAQYAKVFHQICENVLENTSYVEENGAFVVNIDSPWGSGKSFFIDKWHSTIKDEINCVKFDAWASDYGDDPLIPLTAALKDVFPATSYERIVNALWSIPEIGSRIPAALLAASLGPAGIAIAGGSKAIKEYRKESLSRVDKVDAFKKALKDALLASTKKDKKLFIFIDELDRCRPDYAIKVLERIKHMFNIEGLMFIFATDSKQLCASIKGAYGQEFDSSVYLRRFFNQELTLPTPSLSDFCKEEIERSGLSKFFKGDLYPDDLGCPSNRICVVSERLGLSLRDCQRLIQKLNLFYLISPHDLIPHVYIVTILAGILIVDKDSYENIKRNCTQISPNSNAFQTFFNEKEISNTSFAPDVSYLYKIYAKGNYFEQHQAKQLMKASKSLYELWDFNIKSNHICTFNDIFDQLDLANDILKEKDRKTEED